jgi:hypothetical protein
MVQTALVGSVLFGVALIATVAYLSRSGWRRASPATLGGREDASPVERAGNEPMVWTVAFLSAIVAAGLATVAFVGQGFPEGTQGIAGVILVAGGGAVLVGYLFYGTFISARNRGLLHSQAAALGAWMVALLGIVVITLKLVGLF